MKNVVLGVTGGIAVYKAAELVSLLKKAGLSVYVIMTKNAAEFVAPLTFETLSNNPVALDMFNRETPWEVEHISLAKRADVFIVAPATANFIAKMAAGIADDMLTTTVLATRAPVLIAPAMNVNMWENEITQRNVDTLKRLGVNFCGPAEGMLACGDTGKGRMEEPQAILEAALELLCDKKDYKGKKVIVTAGPTREPIDPVRYITNHSSGKMGIEIAKRAKQRGADVLLVHGAVTAQLPSNIQCVRVDTTRDMLNELQKHFDDCDVIIKAAAPADYRAKTQSRSKIKKHGGELALELAENPDILLTLGKQKKHQIMVGFAAETDDVINHAKEKLTRKNLDMLVANDVTCEGAGFSGDTNIVTVIKPDGYIKEYPKATKQQVADFILDEVAALMK